MRFYHLFHEMTINEVKFKIECCCYNLTATYSIIFLNQVDISKVKNGVESREMQIFQSISQEIELMPEGWRLSIIRMNGNMRRVFDGSS